jgi:aminoglycoside 6'-N-acetyltransferase I
MPGCYRIAQYKGAGLAILVDALRPEPCMRMPETESWHLVNYIVGRQAEMKRNVIAFPDQPARDLVSSVPYCPHASCSTFYGHLESLSGSRQRSSAARESFLYTLRNLKRTDLSRCSRLYVQTFNAKPWNDHWTVPTARKRLLDILDSPRFYGLIISAGDELIGAVFGNIERWYDRHHYNLKEMFVQPDLQGSGIGTRIMARVCSDLQKRNVSGIYLLTTTNGGVSRFYTRNHFKQVKGMLMMSMKFPEQDRRA